MQCSLHLDPHHRKSLGSQLEANVNRKGRRRDSGPARHKLPQSWQISGPDTGTEPSPARRHLGKLRGSDTLGEHERASLRTLAGTVKIRYGPGAMNNKGASSSGVVSAPAVVLGSGSRYRRELLARLLPVFEVVAPQVNETPLPGEPAAELANRLAALKADHVAGLRPGAIVIGSDQVAECDGRTLGKPGLAERAIEQLRTCSGRTLVLHTAVCILAPDGQAGATHLDRTCLQFQTLTGDQIARYVERDQPFDCAGSFRFESLGAALFSAVDTRDPTAIQGLPLLWLAAALSRLGVRIL